LALEELRSPNTNRIPAFVGFFLISSSGTPSFRNAPSSASLSLAFIAQPPGSFGPLWSRRASHDSLCVVDCFSFGHRFISVDVIVKALPSYPTSQPCGFEFFPKEHPCSFDPRRTGRCIDAFEDILNSHEKPSTFRSGPGEALRCLAWFELPPRLHAMELLSGASRPPCRLGARPLGVAPRLQEPCCP